MRNRPSALPILALALLAVNATAAPAGAVAVTVYWDAPSTGGFPSGFGVSAATAQSANAAGIPILSLGATDLNELGVTHALDTGSVVIPTPIGSAPATATSNWTATNDTGANDGSGLLENLYLIFARPGENTIVLDGESQTVSYDPADVGLTLHFGDGGIDWVILRVPSNPFDPLSDPVYYPAVSLGTLANGATAAFALQYVLDDPQVFLEQFNFELGLPQWNLYSASIVIPEPATALLVVAGLASIAAARRRAR